jgi:hypothetical protein
MNIDDRLMLASAQAEATDTGPILTFEAGPSSPVFRHASPDFRASQSAAWNGPHNRNHYRGLGVDIRFLSHRAH